VTRVLPNALVSIRAAARTATFFLKVLPMLPSRSVDWVTGTPVVERERYVSPLVAVRELVKFYSLLYPLFRQAVRSASGHVWPDSGNRRGKCQTALQSGLAAHAHS
jgi:hypothetical protein